MTKDEALKMCLEYIETDAHERKYVRHAIKEALAQPAQEKEALKLGIEALENIHNWLPTIGQRGLRDYEADALTAMKEALAQPAQEPVAWMNKHGACMSAVFKAVDATAGEYTIPLYTTPPKRPWVGLTDDEIEKGRDQAVRWAEVALKEKNT